MCITLMSEWRLSGRPLLLERLLREGAEVCSSLSSAEFEKSPIHSAPAPWAATELNISAEGDGGMGQSASV